MTRVTGDIISSSRRNSGGRRLVLKTLQHPALPQICPVWDDTSAQFWTKQRLRGSGVFPQTSLADFFVFTCRLVCGEFRSGLVGRYLTVLDLKMSCRALSASVR